MEFIKEFNVDLLKPAEYNPRKINENAFMKLQESIKEFGVIKPVIVNGDDLTLTAGHQRTKAMKAIDLKKCPVIKINKVSKKDEIRFNLFHNSIETNKTNVILNQEHLKLDDYVFIEPSNIHFSQNKNPVVVKEICQLIAKYGTWGSVVVDTNGCIISNSDYAVACKLLNKKLLVYTIEAEKVEKLSGYFSIDYGEYYYETINAKTYNQYKCQMHRLRGGKVDNKSSLYEKHVIPWLVNNADKRGLDFGAGMCDYVKMLNKKGFNILPYEPHFRYERENKLNIKEVVRMIKSIEKDVKENGLYDFVVLDSVINSITSNEFEEFVMVACNAFLKEDGILFIGTRNKNSIGNDQEYKRAIKKGRMLEFLDKDDFSLTYRSGVWTKQKFHTINSLGEMCSRYFDNVKTDGYEKNSQIYAICSRKKKLDENLYRKSLDTELNMEYPNNYRHNSHLVLLELMRV